MILFPKTIKPIQRFFYLYKRLERAPIDRIRVLQILRDSDGGMKKHVDTLLRGLDHTSIEIILVCSKGQFNKEQLNDMGIRLYELDLGDKHNIFKIIKSFITLVGIVRREKVDIIHAHGITAAIVATLAKFIRPTAVISTTHNFINNSKKLKQRLANILAGHLLKYNDRVVTVSKALKENMIKVWRIPEDKLFLLYNGIDIKGIENQGRENTLKINMEGKVLILNVARLVYEKGVDVFLHAANILLKEKKQRGKMVFLIAGKGPEESNLKNLVKELGIEKEVIFLGFVDEIYSLINKADVVVLSSRSESLGLALLESLALKKPVIASNIGGIPEVIIHKRTGLLVPPDEPELFAQAVLDVLNSNERTRQRVEEGYKMVKESFTQERMIKEIEKIYFELLQPS